MLGAERGSLRGSALAGLLVALVLVVAVPAGPAVGQDRSISREEAAALAEQAGTDDGAQRELREVTEVDGRSVDLRAATEGVGSARADRLAALADALGAGPAGPASPAGPGSGSGGEVDQRAAARRSAREVLADRKYQEGDVPKPFKGVLGWLADRLRPIGRIFEPILALPGGAFILGVLLVAAGAIGVTLLISRSSRAAVDRGRASLLVDPSLDPSDLEDRAARAETDGDLTASVRLRYQAGLVRLVRADRLVLRADTTAASAARQVDLAVMDRLTVDFEEIVYGDRTPTTADVDRARHGWAEVLGARSAR